jgi:hypothetical protein
MTRAALLRSWFVAPPLSGKWTILWILAALPVAFLIRQSMNCPDAIGECCTPLFIFVLASAVLLGWKAAIFAAVSAGAVSIWLYSGPGHVMDGGGELAGMTLFLFYCALIIGCVEFVRSAFARLSRVSVPEEHSSGIIFSREDGHAWASWPGNSAPIRLGPDTEVTAMMRDFVSQVELADRLARRSSSAA